jgi:hypothetical protein
MVWLSLGNRTKTKRAASQLARRWEAGNEAGKERLALLVM